MEKQTEVYITSHGKEPIKTTWRGEMSKDILDIVGVRYVGKHKGLPLLEDDAYENHP